MQEDNVRVAVRVRPILPKEKLAGEQLCVKIISSTKQVVLGKDRAFTFDHVISSKTSQDDVYEKCVEPLVKACFEGYNATVFAYGQTGSGKTYTVGGGNISSLTEDEYGIIPRAIKQMYEIIQTNPNREYTARVSYVEIYKEELCDLLDLETSSKDLHIREDDKGNTLIMGATELECQTMDEVMTCLEQGSAYRHTGSTQMNEHSSRSHSVFTVSIEQRWSDSDVPLSARPKDDDCEEVIDDPGEIIHNMCAKFHFVDLAGSERAHRTGNVGDRFKESVHINSGLLALGNVISALGDVKKKSTHIPYRDSKITRLLKDSLGGNAKTLMICCISPVVSSFDESLNALKYANRARNIKNKPIINRDVQSIRFEEMQSEIKALREELQRQRTSMFTTSDFDSQKATQDAEVVKAMEDKVVSLQTECSHYRMIAEEAYKQLLDIQQRDILSQSQNVRLGDWMELMEEIKHQVPATLNKDEWENQTIIRLQEELKQCRNDLRSDEEIFAEKTKELSNLYDRIAELESMSEESDHRLQEALDRQKQQEEQLVAQQVKIEELNQKLKQKEVSLESSQCDLDSSSRSLGPPTTSRRAKSVPAHMVGNRSARAPDVPPRNIHTSPALFSLDRVMQSFRARSNLIVSRLEDDDDVLQQAFSDEEQRPGGSDGEEGQEAVDGKEAFLRGEQKRGTYTVKKSASVKRTNTYKLQKRDLHGRQTDDEKISVRNGEDVENVNPDGQSMRKSKNHDMMNGDEPGWKQSQAQRSTERQMKQLKYSQLEVQQSTQKLKDLSINIRMKEQLIKELVKTGKEAQHVNKQYADKIKTLEKEKLAAKQELVSLQKAMQDIEAKEQQENVEKEKLQKEFRKKMEKAKTRIHDLQKKQKETEKMASLTGQNDKRIQDLEMAIDRMKNQQDGLQRRLKEELDRKVKLEREMQREQQRVKELEIKNEQQKKVLRIKTEEMTAMQRKLRTGNQLTPPSEEQTKLEEQKRWLDSELEKVLEQRQQMESLQKDLQRREEILMKKEAMLSERSELEMKKLRSSQVLNKDIITVANKLELMDRQIEEKNQEMNTTPEDHKKQVKEEIKSLQQGRDRLRKQRAVIDTKLKDGTILSGQEERRLIELDEAVEALDAAIEYKNEAIVARQQELRKSAMLTQSEDNLMAKLNSLTSTETKTLLSRYFEKVIDLREDEHRKELQCSELEMKIDEQERMIRELQGTMQRAAMETDRKLTHQQQEYEKKIQLLMKQLSEADGASSSGGSGRSSATGDPDVVKDAKIQQLEKDLYYYKKTSRDLKKKLREVLAGHIGGDVDRDDADLGPTPRDVNSPKPATPRLNDIHSTKGLPSARSEAGGRENHNSDRLNNGSVRSNTSARSHKEDVPNRGGMSARTERLAEEPGSSRRHSSEKEDDVFSARDKGGDGANTTVTPIKISRKDLRRMSEEEVHLRKSAASQNSPRLADSLETSRNPWT